MELIQPNGDVRKSKGGIILPDTRIKLVEKLVPAEVTPQPVPQEFAMWDIPIIGETG